MGRSAHLLSGHFKFTGFNHVKPIQRANTILIQTRFIFKRELIPSGLPSTAEFINRLFIMIILEI